MKQNNMGSRWAGLVLLVFALLSVACVSNTTGGSRTNVDKAKALELHIQLAEGYIRNNNRESARHHLRRAFDIDRNSIEATATMARLYEMEGENELAEQYYQRALRRNKDMTRTRNDYGLFLYREKRYEDSLDQFEIAAADLDYDDRARVLVNVGRAAAQLGNTTRAEAAFKHANTLNRRLPSALIELADISFQQQDYASAKTYLDQYGEVARPSPRSLLLGIRIERLFGNKDREASYALALRNMFPYSREYLEYKRFFE